MSVGEKLVWTTENGQKIDVVTAFVNEKQVKVRFVDEKGWKTSRWVSPRALSVPGDSVDRPDKAVSELAIGTEEDAGDQFALCSRLFTAEAGLGASENPENLVSHLPLSK